MIITIGRFFLLLVSFALHADTIPISQRQMDARPFISCELSVATDQPFVGERVPCVFRVVYDPRSYTLDNIFPSTSQDVTLEFFKKNQKEQQIVNGVACSVCELEGVLYPKKSGNVIIEPFKVAVTQRSSGLRGFMGFVMNSSTSLFSNQVVMKVQQLPQTSSPTFGLIGSFSSVYLELERNTVAAGEAIMLRYYLKGLGNTTHCKHPPLQLPDDLKWYAAESKQEEDGHCFEYAIQAIHEKDILIPAQSCVYFDTYYKKYKALTTSPVWIHVTPSKQIKVSDAPVAQPLPEKENEYQDQEKVVEEVVPTTVSLMRSFSIPDQIFGFLVVVGMLGLCVRFSFAWLLVTMNAFLAWWRYRRLLARVRYEVKHVQEYSDVKKFYAAFKDLQEITDWSRVKDVSKNQTAKLDKDTWHNFWQRLECARFDIDSGTRIPENFVQEAEQWITYFEMQR